METKEGQSNSKILNKNLKLLQLSNDNFEEDTWERRLYPVPCNQHPQRYALSIERTVAKIAGPKEQLDATVWPEILQYHSDLRCKKIDK